MTPLNAAQRLKLNVRRLLADQRSVRGGPRRTIAGLAKALGVKANGISTILKRPDVPHFKLRDLDDIAHYFGVPPAVLVKADTSALVELTPSEMALLRHWRAFPREVQDQLSALLTYFAGIAPDEKAMRRFVSKFRRLSQTDQEYVERTMDSLRRHTDERDTGAPPAPEGGGPSQ